MCNCAYNQFQYNLFDVNFHSCSLSLTHVLKEFDMINNKTSPGPDMISNRFFI